MPEILKILILEDSDTDAVLVQQLLYREKLQCIVSVAIDKETFRVALDQFQPDIILSDHSLPQFDSAEALILARQRFPGIPFIMVTGTVSEEFAAGIIKLGADDYILKDRMARLPAAINKTIQRRISEKEKQEAERKIIQSETNLRTIFENTSEGFLLLDTDAVVMAFNSKASALAFFSSSQEFQIGQSLYNCIDKPGKEFIRVIIAKVLNGESIQYDRSYNMENATIAWANFSATPVFELGEVKNICMVCRDITQQKLMEKEIIDQKIQEQKKIARAIIKVEEKVRNHIGTELHDNINQVLATTKMLLGIASKKNEDTKRLVQRPMELIDHSIEEIRLLCHELVTTLKDIDLQIMIRDLLINFGNNTLIKTGFTYLESNGTVSDDLKLNIYRIIQEQLNNVLKHASAKKVSVSVKVDKNSINVTVIDDGMGFDVKEKRKGIGISNIKNRVESYNGKLEIISSPGNGCIINIEVPC